VQRIDRLEQDVKAIEDGKGSTDPAVLYADVLVAQYHLQQVWNGFENVNEHQAVDLSTAAVIGQPVRTSAEPKVAQIALGNIIGRWQPLKGGPPMAGPVQAKDIVNSVGSKHVADQPVLCHGSQQRHRAGFRP
jgi:hypothetical protein